MTPRGPAFTRAALRIGWRGLRALLLGVYLVASRAGAFIAALWLCLYFFSGTSAVQGALQDVVAKAIPGIISVGSVRWGPAPDELRVADLRIAGEHAEEVVRIPALTVDIDLLATLAGSVRQLTRADAPLLISLSRVRLGQPHARIRVDEQGRVGIERAFNRDEDPPGEGPGIALDLRAAEVEILGASGRITAPNVDIEVEGLDTFARYTLTGTAPHMRFTLPYTRVRQVSLRLPPTHTAGHAPVAPEARFLDLQVDTFRWDGLTFRWRHAHAQIEGGGRVEGPGAFDVGVIPPAWSGAIQITLPSAVPFLRATLGDLVDGPITATMSGAGTVEQAAMHITFEGAGGRAGPVPLGAVRGAFRTVPLGHERPGGARAVAHAIEVDRLEADVFGGRVSVASGYLGPPPHARPEPGELLDDHLVGSLLLEGVDAGAAARAVGLDVGSAPGVVLDGLAQLAVVLGPERLAATLSTEGLGVGWEVPSGVPLAERFTFAGTVAWEEGPPAPGDPDLLGTRRLAFERIALEGGGDRLNLQGVVDVARATLDLEPYLRFGEIHARARRLGAPLHGRFVIKDARLVGTFDAPRLTGELSWSSARVAGQRLGHVTARLGLADDTLELARVAASTELGRVGLDARLRLFDGGFPRLHPTLPFEVPRLEAQGLALGGLLDAVTLRAPVDVSRARLSGQLRDVLGTLQGEGTFRTGAIDFAGEAFRELSGRFDAQPRRVGLSELRLTTRDGDVITGSLSVTRPGGRLHGTLLATGIPLASIRTLGRALGDVGGSISANLNLGGTPDRPSIIGRLSLAAVRLGDVRLGDAEVDVQTMPDGRVDLSSTRFFPGFDLTDGSGLTADGGRLHIGVRALGARLTDLLPGLRASGLQVTTDATALFDLPGRGGRSFDLRLAAGPGELSVGLRDQGLRYTNLTPLALARERERVVLSPVTFALDAAGGADPGGEPASEVHLCGSLDPRAGLELQLGGEVGVGVLRHLKDVFSLVDGVLRIAPDATTTAAVAESRCLPADHEGVLLVRGPLDALDLSGRLEPHGVTIVPRGLRREIRLDDGRGVLLRPGARRGELRVVSPAGTGVTGELDDGVFGLAGEVTLVGFALDRVELDLVGTDIYFARPGEFTATFTPSLRLSARRFGSPQPEASLRGSVLVTDGHFTRSFDNFARALGAAVGGAGADAYSRPITEDLPWLRDVVLDLDVTSSSFWIRSAFPLGRTDLEARLDLSILGTVGDPRVHRRVDLLPGGLITYQVFGRDFEIVSGFVDFAGDPDQPTLDIAAQTSVTYIARASTEIQDEDERSVMITVRIFGRVPDLKIDMASDDASFDQDDLQSLIITGRPRRDLDRATGASLVTADIAGVLSDILQAPFVRTVAVGLGREGDLRADVATCFGRDLCFTTSAVQEPTETTLRARFRLRLGDALTCDGTLRRSDAIRRRASSGENYEARCRYRIPLD